MNLFRKHSIEYTLEHLQEDQSRQLKRSLKWPDIAIMAVSVCVGAGIFSVGAKVISQQAGPASIISFLLAGGICGLAAMCYAEFSSVLPVAGSAYTYSYSSMGEIVAWIIGWDLMLELFLSAAVILKYWCVYLYDAIELLGFGHVTGVQLGPVTVDWPIFVAMAIFTVVLIKGTKFTTRFATAFVVLKLFVIGIVVVMGARFFSLANFTPFIPPATTEGVNAGNPMRQSLFSFLLGQEPQTFGIFGIFAGAGIIFFAFVGFDDAASVAEETINPRKNLPIGLMVGVGLVTLLYEAVAVVTAGMVPYTAFADWSAAHPGDTASLTTAFKIVGDNSTGAIIAIGIVFGLVSVIIISMLGFSRIAFAMSRDGLLPRGLSVTTKTGKTPYRILIIGAIGVTFIAAFMYVDVLDEMINIGTLSAFILVSFGVPIYRRIQETTEHTRTDSLGKSKPFRVPFSPFLPILSGVVCIWLTLQLAVQTWICFLVWCALGLAIYFFYGRKNSQLAKHPEYAV